MSSAMKFNKQPFNRAASNIEFIEGIAYVKISAAARGIAVTNLSGSAEIAVESQGKPTKVIHCGGTSKIAVTVTGAGIRRLKASGLVGIIINSQAAPIISEEAFINLSGLTLKPGDVLVIDTGEMTVSLNGAPAIEYFSINSDFFRLLRGENIITYKDASASRNVSVDIIWKARFL